MNKYETALLRLMCLDDGEEKDALNIVAELVERATPKKHLADRVCPNCTCYHNNSDYKYCPDCGQALDWSEEAREHYTDIIIGVDYGGNDATVAVARKIGTYNCKTNVLTLYNATDNDLLSEQVFFRAGLEQIREEYNNE